MGQKKILIIDDEHTLLRLSQIIFQRKGYAVSVALSVKEGRNHLVNNSPYDAVILDLMMPEETGFDFLKWQEAQAEPVKSTPVIVNSAKNLTEDEKAYLVIDRKSVG